MGTRDHPDWWRPMGGQNSQDSILERRSTVWNDDGIVAPTVPASFYEAAIYKGKFFTRGCRGMIEQIQLYCIGDGVDEITLRYSPHPSTGPYGDVAIVPAAAWAWQPFVIEEMWNYDSLFIWVYEAEANVDWAYDAVQPYDGHVSADAGATWADMAIRPFIRVEYTGETPGDVPVSGTLNTVEVPSVGGVVEPEAPVTCPDGVITNLVTFHGAGTMTMARVRGHAFVIPNHYTVYYQMTIFADGWRALTVDNLDLTQSPVAVAGRSSMGEFSNYTVDEVEYMVMNVRVPIKFRRRLLLRFRQQTGAAMDIGGELYINAQR